MNYRLFSNEIEPSCSYCEHGEPSLDSTMILCPKKGVVEPFYRCRAFVYAPLKRIPRKPNRLPEFDPSDFLL